MTTRLGRQLKAARLGHGFTVRELQKRTGIAIGQISMMETGVCKHPEPATLRAMARGLNLNYVRLLIDAGHLTELELLRDARRAVNGRAFT